MDITLKATVLVAALMVLISFSAGIETDFTQNKTFTDINTGYDMPVQPSNALGIILVVIGIYFSLAAVMKPEFMW